MTSLGSKRQKYANVRGILPVLAAFLGNFIVMILKWIAFFVSGSSSMFSEAIHSVADSSNQFLLLIGIRRSQLAPNDKFGYGFGQERFFWGLISACGIFFLGAGITIYHGFETFFSHQIPEYHPFVFIVLVTSFFVEGSTLLLAIRDLKKNNIGKKISYVMAYGDPITLAVIYEDSVAVFGVLVAVIGIMMTRITGSIYWDATGSIIIGLMLGIIAVILINKNREVLISRSMPEHLKECILEVLKNDPAIEKVIDFKSSMLDVGAYRVKCEVEFNGSSLLTDLYRRDKDFLKDEYEYIRDDYQEFLKFCADYTDRIPRLIGGHIDVLEANIRIVVPEAKYIDIEIN